MVITSYENNHMYYLAKLAINIIQEVILLKIVSSNKELNSLINV